MCRERHGAAPERFMRDVQEMARNNRTYSGHRDEFCDAGRWRAVRDVPREEGAEDLEEGGQALEAGAEDGAEEVALGPPRAHRSSGQDRLSRPPRRYGPEGREGFAGRQ